MDGPSRKRTRDEFYAGSSTAAAPLKQESIADLRDPKFWFEDGNIILIARTVSFRVYKGLLAEHSAVFRSMFHIAQGTQAASEQADGCPVVPLDDSPGDLRHLFRIIFPLNSGVRLNKADATLDMETISAIIRLDHKYELTALCSQAMNYLTTYYTTNYDAWINGTNSIHLKPEPFHAITAVCLARLTHTVSILPTAFYLCATLSLSEILNGYTRQDGVVERLSSEDVELCLRLRDQLINLNTASALAVFKAPSPRCLTGSGMLIAPGFPITSTCANIARKVIDRALMGKTPHILTSPFALDPWKPTLDSCQTAEVMREIGARQPLCQSCTAHVMETESQMRRNIWRTLPRLLGITVNEWEVAPTGQNPA
ncbi:hypothetical protein C8Q79DRAFT_920679 [Trametes meyenii]|nr:hypothetical protein C8Q79DRAFT_920679 [Trametes meyenii]